MSYKDTDNINVKILLEKILSNEAQPSENIIQIMPIFKNALKKYRKNKKALLQILSARDKVISFPEKGERKKGVLKGIRALEFNFLGKRGRLIYAYLEETGVIILLDVGNHTEIGGDNYSRITNYLKTKKGLQKTINGEGR